MQYLRIAGKIIGVLLAASAIFLSCPMEDNNKNGTLVLRLPGNDGGRTVSTAFLSTLHYRINCDGSANVSHEARPGETVSISLVAGDWTITIIAFNAADQEIGRAAMPVSITARETTSIQLPVLLEKSGNDITQFDIISPVNAEGIIDQDSAQINVFVPDGTNINRMNFSLIHTGVSISPAPNVPLNFSNARNFTVTAEDGTTKIYTVTVIVTNIVTFDKNNTSAGSTEANPQTMYVTSPATTIDDLPADPARPGWTFAGWNTQANGSGTAFTANTTVTGNITVYAQWTPNTYTVTFDKNNDDYGSTEANPQTRTVTTPAATVSVLPAAPVRTGHIFSGWNTQANGSGTAFTANTVVTGDITVYAQWVELDMVFIGSGTYMRGSTDTNYDIHPPHQVILTKSFHMGKYEVTQEQYQAVTGVNPSNPNNTVSILGETALRRPVDSVSWFDAVEFCNKLSVLEGLTQVYTITGRTPASGYPITAATVTANWNANGYRLPTEAEWEYACRAGTTTEWYTGNFSPDAVWYKSNSNGKSHEVGKKTPNAWNLYDMNGNLWEYCWDIYGFYSTNSQQTDPRGANSGTKRTARGASWDDNEIGLLGSVGRGNVTPSDTPWHFGFRVVRFSQ